jgi:serine/threonine protein kinase
MAEDVTGYRVLEKAGEGGFSVVYRAYQERLDRQVALKVLSISAVDDQAMRRFQRECKITGRLSGHPNVVTVLDVGTTRADRPYIAMEYFEHGSLTDRLMREGPLPVPDVLRVGVKMAGALAATHEIDVLHRDVKPQNILVSRYGEPALADFGIARLVDSFDSTHTTAFTPHHAAPEVLEGRPPGVPADLYSLGSTLYQLLAGKPAFRGPQNEGIASLMLRILHDPPPPIPRSDLPPAFFEVIQQAMDKDPAQRFPSAVAFAQRLQAVQAGLGLPVTDLAHSGAGFPDVPLADSRPAPGPAAPGFPGFPGTPTLPGASANTQPRPDFAEGGFPALSAPTSAEPRPAPADASTPPAEAPVWTFGPAGPPGGPAPPAGFPAIAPPGQESGPPFGPGPDVHRPGPPPNGAAPGADVRRPGEAAFGAVGRPEDGRPGTAGPAWDGGAAGVTGIDAGQAGPPATGRPGDVQGAGMAAAWGAGPDGADVRQAPAQPGAGIAQPTGGPPGAAGPTWSGGAAGVTGVDVRPGRDGMTSRDAFHRPGGGWGQETTADPPVGVGPNGTLEGPGRGRSRRGLVIAAGAVAGGLLVGTTAVVLLSGGGSSGGGTRPTTTPASPQAAPTGTASGGAAPGTAQALSQEEIGAARPRNVTVVFKGEAAILHWRLLKGNRYPLFISRDDGSTPLTLRFGITSTVIRGLDPGQPYCFTVAALLTLSPPQYAKAKPVCTKPRK